MLAWNVVLIFHSLTFPSYDHFWMSSVGHMVMKRCLLLTMTSAVRAGDAVCYRYLRSDMQAVNYFVPSLSCPVL